MKTQNPDNALIVAGKAYLLLALVVPLCLFIYATAAYQPLDRQMLLGWGVFGLIILIRRYYWGETEVQRIVLMIFCFFLTARYWYFRTTETLLYTGPVDFAAMMILYVAESYGILTHFLGMFVNVHPIKRKIVPVDLDDPNLPTVDVFIPTYSEPEVMVAITASACTKFDYPKDKLNVYILDDGGTVQKRNDPDPAKAEAARKRHLSLKGLAEFLEINYMTRARNEHAKAGNVNQALLCTNDRDDSYESESDPCIDPEFHGKGGDLVLILDCDHVPTRDFLKNTVGHFMEDERVFLLQTPHFFINPDPIEKNLGTYVDKPSENEMFYGAVHLGLDFWNASFFCGSAAILRRKHLMEVGGLSGETITEDAETALSLHARGYKSVYIAKPMVCGLSPEVFSDFILQRNRWAQGMTQIFLLKNPLLMKGLSPAQRICYLNSCIFWFFSLARLVFFMAPLLYLFFGLRVYNASLLQVLAYAFPHVFSAILLTDYLYGHLRHPFFSELYEVVQSVFNVPALVSVFFKPRAPSFKVTPKEQSLASDFLSPLALPFYIMLLLVLAAYPFAVVRWFLYPFETDAIYITTFWATFNLALVLLCFGVVWERKQIRRKHRISTDESITIRLAGGRTFPARMFDLSEDGLGCRLDEPAELPVGVAVDILAQDSYGNEYTLPADLVRVVHQAGHVECGVVFLGQDGLSWMETLSFVYGDSERWLRFWLKRRRRVGLGRGITYLLVKGVDGFSRNFVGLIQLGFAYLKRMGGMVWKRALKSTG